MYILFYSDISEFSVNLLRMIDEGRNKRSIQNTHKIVWKENYFKSSDVSMLGHACGVLQFPTNDRKNIHGWIGHPHALTWRLRTHTLLLWYRG